MIPSGNAIDLLRIVVASGADFVSCLKQAELQLKAAQSKAEVVELFAGEVDMWRLPDAILTPYLEESERRLKDLITTLKAVEKEFGS